MLESECWLGLGGAERGEMGGGGGGEGGGGRG